MRRFPDTEEAQANRDAHSSQNPVKVPWCRHLTDEGVAALRASLNADGIREYYLEEVRALCSCCVCVWGGGDLCVVLFT